MRRRVSSVWFASIAAACAVASAEPAPKSKLAVLVLGAGVEPDLAENLSEVIIAKVAKTGLYETAGREELRGLLGVDSDLKALACVDDPGCLGRAGAALGATKVLAGTVGRQGKDYLFSLVLHDLPTGRIENRSFRLVPGGVPALLKVVDETAMEVFERRKEPGNVRVEAPLRGARVYVDDVFIGTTPVRSPMLESGSHSLRVEAEGHREWGRPVTVPSGATLDVTLPPGALPEQRRWPSYLGWTTLSVAVAAAAGGALLAVLSQETPAGLTRRDQLADVEHKHTQAIVADVLFATAGAFAITSGIVFYTYRHDVFGGGATVAATVTPTGQVVAALQW